MKRTNKKPKSTANQTGYEKHIISIFNPVSVSTEKLEVFIFLN